MSTPIVLHAIPAVECDFATIFDQSFKTLFSRFLNLLYYRKWSIMASRED